MDNKKINDEKATNKWYILIGGGIGLLGLIVSIFAFGKTGKCNNRLSRHREEIESLRQLLNERRFEPNVTGTKRTIIQPRHRYPIMKSLICLENTTFRE